MQNLADNVVNAIIEAARALGVMLLAFVAMLAIVVKQTAQLLTALCKPIVVVLVIGATIGLTFAGSQAAWRAYGADLPALVPAMLLCTLPAAIAIPHRTPGAFLASGLAAYTIGTLALSVDLTARALIVVTAIATTITMNQNNRRATNEKQ